MRKTNHRKFNKTAQPNREILRLKPILMESQNAA